MRNYDEWKFQSFPETEEDESCKVCESCNEPIGLMNESKISELCIDCYNLIY